MPGNTSELLGFPSLYDNAVLLSPIHDALRGYPNLASPGCTAQDGQETPDLFLSFVQPAVAPVYFGMSRQEAVQWKAAHPDDAAYCAGKGRKKLKQKWGIELDEAECLNAVHSQHEECAQLHNTSSLTMLNVKTARRHFVLQLGGSSRGEILRPTDREFDLYVLCYPIPPLAIRRLHTCKGRLGGSRWSCASGDERANTLPPHPTTSMQGLW
jgi:hypothetical protein